SPVTTPPPRGGSRCRWSWGRRSASRRRCSPSWTRPRCSRSGVWPEVTLPHSARRDDRHGARPTAPDPLPIPVVDNHTHLDMGRGEEPRPDLGESLREALAVGVDRVVQIGCDLPGARYTIEAVEAEGAVLG